MYPGFNHEAYAAGLPKRNLYDQSTGINADLEDAISPPPVRSSSPVFDNGDDSPPSRKHIDEPKAELKAPMPILASSRTRKRVVSPLLSMVMSKPVAKKQKTEKETEDTQPRQSRSSRSTSRAALGIISKSSPRLLSPEIQPTTHRQPAARTQASVSQQASSFLATPLTTVSEAPTLRRSSRIKAIPTSYLEAASIEPSYPDPDFSTPSRSSRVQKSISSHSNILAVESASLATTDDTYSATAEDPDDEEEEEYDEDRIPLDERDYLVDEEDDVDPETRNGDMDTEDDEDEVRPVVKITRSKKALNSLKPREKKAKSSADFKTLRLSTPLAEWEAAHGQKYPVELRDGNKLRFKTLLLNAIRSLKRRQASVKWEDGVGRQGATSKVFWRLIQKADPDWAVDTQLLPYVPDPVQWVIGKKNLSRNDLKDLPLLPDNSLLASIIYISLPHNAKYAGSANGKRGGSGRWADYDGNVSDYTHHGQHIKANGKWTEIRAVASGFKQAIWTNFFETIFTIIIGTVSRSPNAGRLLPGRCFTSLMTYEWYDLCRAEQGPDRIEIDALDSIVLCRFARAFRGHSFYLIARIAGAT